MDLLFRAAPVRRPGDLVERFAITLPDGTAWEGSLHKSMHRAVGRRILVRDAAGALLFDTDECYDHGNARASLDGWLAAELTKREAAAWIAAESDRLAAEGLALLNESVELALVEEAARQMKCDNCNAVGTEENPLVPVESSAAHPEGYVHGAGCPDAGPHHEDAHADSAPLG